jgi:hypothetical protein
LVALAIVLLAARLLVFGLTNQSVRASIGIGTGLPSCHAAGISTPAGREGKCARIHGLFSETVYNVVDRQRPLRMPEYEARILASKISATRVRQSPNTLEYPGRQGLLVSYELMVTNITAAPLPFTAGSETVIPHYPKHPRVALLIPVSPGSEEDQELPELLNPNGAPSPPLTQPRPIPAGGTVTGWVTFVVPSAMGALLTARPADLDLYRVENATDYVGQIRLWK